MHCSRLALVIVPAAVLLGQGYQAGVDPRVELMSILFRLAGADEYNQGRIPSYLTQIDSHFAPVKDHAAVRYARELRKSDGVSFDAVMSMAVHLTDVKTLGERVPFDKAPNLDKRWKPVQSRRFLELLRKFVADSDFETFLNSQQELFDLTNSRLREFADKNADLGWFDRFFGRRAEARLLIVPGMTNGGSSYGAAVTPPDGVQEIYAIPGVYSVDAEGKPEFRGSLATLVHEFIHSYSNPLIDMHRDKLRAAGERLIAPVREQMQRQAYSSGHTVLYESMVRASTARYILEHQGAEAAERAIRSEQGRAFIWTPELFELLGEYAASREKYPNLDAFMPRIVEFFDKQSRHVPKMLAAYRTKVPKVASINIRNGAKDVDPALAEIVVRFTKPMRTDRYSVAQTSEVAMPRVLGKPEFAEDATVMRVPVQLEPGKEYAFSLNWPGGGAFQSDDGYTLEHVPVRFRTRAAPRVRRSQHNPE